jgi:CYTH domain-containing protein
MALEIERKFLVRSDAWRRDPDLEPGVRLRQGYLQTPFPDQVRVRLVGDHEAVLTLKQEESERVRREFEYAIPAAEARQLLATFCGDRVVDKIRYRLPTAGLAWEIDVYQGRHDGLITADLELPDVDRAFTLPEWVGAEITGQARYSNVRLASDGGAEA